MSLWESRWRCITDPLTVFFLPLIVSLTASLLLRLFPLGEIALHFNAAYQGCLPLATPAWYRRGGKNSVQEERSFPWRDFARTLCFYLLLMLLLDRSSFAMPDRLHQSNAGVLRNLGG